MPTNFFFIHINRVYRDKYSNIFCNRSLLNSLWYTLYIRSSKQPYRSYQWLFTWKWYSISSTLLYSSVKKDNVYICGLNSEWSGSGGAEWNNRNEGEGETTIFCTVASLSGWLCGVMANFLCDHYTGLINKVTYWGLRLV